MSQASVFISVVIITYNEAGNIARCIQSVKSIANEIVVVDSFSNDGTQEIAKKLGARVIEHTFEGHIQQKNWAIEQVSYKHILSLDADECLSEELILQIKKAKENFNVDGYNINRLNYYCGTWIKHGGWYPDVKLRLWNSEKGSWQGTNPHDEYVLQKGSSINHLQGDLLHYTYLSQEQHFKQIDYFTNIAANAYFMQKKKSTIFHIYINPTIKFIKDYFIKLGFLDGKAGYLVAKNSAYATYLKYKKLKNLYKK